MLNTKIPKVKMGKKQKRELNAAKRVTWGFSPVSRVKDSRKRDDHKFAQKNMCCEF